MESLLQTFLREQGYVLFEPAPDGLFALVSEPPQWFRKIWGPEPSSGKPLNIGGASPYLESFLPTAHEFWKSHTDGVCASGTWVERTAGREDVPLEAVALHVNGRPLLSIYSPKDEFEQTTRYLQTARDSKLAHERLLREIQKKEILLHCIVHDLSQPLSAMRGCFECLALESTTPKAKQFVEIGKQQTERQETLIREIVQAFAEDLKSTMRSSDSTKGTDMLACARETVAAFSPRFESAGAAIRVSPQIDATADWSVAGEESRLKRIFSNLVENSLRYTARNGTVTIGLDVDHRFIRAFVDDEGPGLPAESSPSRIFALFSKGKECGGKAGLGLYFCKMTVERWGGSIGCESLPQRGARFWFRLPRAKASVKGQSPAAPIETADSVVALGFHGPTKMGSQMQDQKNASERQSMQSEKPAAALRILLAEDQEDLRQLTAHLLGNQGHVVVAVPDGRTALQALTKQRFDVLLLDEEMPGMTGVEVTCRIREREKTDGGHQTILALTGNTTEQDQQRLLGAGVDSWLGKPFDLADLLRRLAELKVVPAAKSKADAAPAPAEPSDLLARVGGDSKLLRTMIKTFLRDSKRKLSEMKRALSRKNGMALAAAAHALKGSASIFGSERAIRCSQQLQEMGRSGELARAPEVLQELEKEIALLHEKLRGYDTAGSQSSRKAVRQKRGRTRSERRKKS